MEFGEEITTNCNYTCSGTLFKCIVSLLNAMHHVCLFQVVCGGIKEEKFSSAKGEKKNLLLLPLNPVQLLPAYRYWQSRLYKTFNGVRGRQI